jgi:16S rRNA (guanine1207-N2)-methyltransferase
MNDQSLQLILAAIEGVQSPGLLFADENASPLIPFLNGNAYLTVITNRCDLYQQAKQQSLNVIFTDFKTRDYPDQKFDHIFYRISKEKALTHHLINQAIQLLSSDGELIITGGKQEGIKSYSDKIKKQLEAQGSLKKFNSAYLGRFTHLSSDQQLDDNNYVEIRLINNESKGLKNFYSKPGVYGWDKIDEGTQLLLESLNLYLHKHKPQINTVLDLGCGYGWIFLNLDDYGFTSITATDNNSAAINCSIKNTEGLKTSVTIKPSDCANNIKEKFDLVICNPPFHKGFKHDKSLIEKFILSAKAHLNDNGSALFVVNEFIGIEKIASQYFITVDTLEKKNGFKVFLLRND